MTNHYSMPCPVCGDTINIVEQESFSCTCGYPHREKNKYYDKELWPHCGPEYKSISYISVDIPDCETIMDYRAAMSIEKHKLAEQHYQVGFYIIDKKCFDLWNEEWMSTPGEYKGYDKRPYRLDEFSECFIIKEIIMPLPKPKKNEDKDTYVSRFMEKTKNDSTLTQKQRLAIAYKNWRERNKK